MKKLIFLLLTFFTTQAFAAWDAVTTGTIAQIDVTSGNNYGFRISLKNSPQLCANEHRWAYLNENDSNYNVYVSVLMAAKAANQTVIVFTNRKDNSPTGFCHIGYIAVR